MPYKLKIIKELQRNIKSTIIEKSHDDKHQDNPSNTLPPKIKSKYNNKKIIGKNYNIFQLIYIRELSWNHHVVTFYNIIGLNQKAISLPDFEESKFTTIFYIKSVKKVEIKSKVVAIQLCNSSLTFPPVEYIVQRYKSFGDVQFFRLAQLLEETSERIKSIEQVQLNSVVDDTSEAFEKFVEQQGNKMFICRSTSNKLVISKTLLDLLGYNIEEFAIEIVKYKAPLNEIFSSSRYFDIVFKMLQNLKNLFDLLNEKITLQTFLHTSIIHFRDYLISKNQVNKFLSKKKVFCQLKVGMPTPILNIIEVEEVIQHKQQSTTNAIHHSDFQQNLQNIQKKRQFNEVNIVRQILHLPQNILPQNKNKIASYTSLNDQFKQQCYSDDEQIC